MDQYRHSLLRKTELHITGISLAHADLGEIAKAVADSLSLDRTCVLVTDVRPHRVTVDILAGTLDVSGITGRERKLLEALSEVKGVVLESGAFVHADGMLGWIAADDPGRDEALARARAGAADIAARIKKRAIVFSTGSEVAGGEVRDTNMPVIADALERRGYAVRRGGVLGDDHVIVAGAIRYAIENGGYGLVVTTGGVGAEEKDLTVEAVLMLDPDAAAPYISRYEQGKGRHVKDGVRIAVGEFGGAMIVALPGPHEEVRLCLDILCESLERDPDKHTLAVSIADVLRRRLRQS